MEFMRMIWTSFSVMIVMGMFIEVGPMYVLMENYKKLTLFDILLLIIFFPAPLFVLAVILCMLPVYFIPLLGEKFLSYKPFDKDKNV